jgi:putative DNA primase/helicase
MDFNQIIHNFQVAMLTHGVTPPDYIVADGQLQRFYIQGDKRGSKNGWYAIFADNIPCGIFGSWKIGITHKWCSKKREYMSNWEYKKYKQQIEEAKLQRKEVRAREQAEAANLAEHIFYSCPFADPNHLYLVLKCIKPFYARQKGRYLVLPIIDFDGNFHSLQYIAPNGDKWFLPNGAIAEHFIPIQHQLVESMRILICESFSTAGSLAQAYPDACVIAACAAGNLKAVAVDIRLHLPRAEIVLCCDDDRLNPANPGIKHGREAAFAAEAFFTSPNWPEDAPANLTDFNDLQNWLSRTGSAK